MSWWIALQCHCSCLMCCRHFLLHPLLDRGCWVFRDFVMWEFDWTYAFLRVCVDWIEINRYHVRHSCVFWIVESILGICTTTILVPSVPIIILDDFCVVGTFHACLCSAFTHEKGWVTSVIPHRLQSCRKEILNVGDEELNGRILSFLGTYWYFWSSSIGKRLSVSFS